jgi:hypothetical protein
MASLRTMLGALAYDLPRYAASALRRGGWIHLRNRGEQVSSDGRGIACDWKFTSALHVANVFPKSGTRLMRSALAQWPIAFADAPPATDAPDVTFLIGHRGSSRLPHLLLTLRSIAAQEGAAIECIVVEQSPSPELRAALPPWTRYVHQHAEPDQPYRRSATFNEGERHARGRLLVIHDNDMLVPQRYAAEILARADDGFEAMDLKRFIFYLTPADSGRALSTGRLALDERSESVIQNLRGGSIAITRIAYEAIGGFDESFVGWGGEDLEFWERAETRRATRFGYLPIVHLWHAAQPEKLDLDRAPAVQRYHELAAVPAGERIARLRRARP